MVERLHEKMVIRLLTLLVLFALTLGTTGCLPWLLYESRSADGVTMGSASSEAIPDGQGRVYVYRTGSIVGAASHPIIGEGDHVLGGLRRNGYFEHFVPEGECVFWQQHETRYPLSIAAGETIYLKTSGSLGFERVDAEDAIGELNGLVRVQPENRTDECPGSDLRGTVFVGVCDSGAPNTLRIGDFGCTNADLIAHCTEARTLDAYRACANEGLDRMQLGIRLSSRDRGAIFECAKAELYGARRATHNGETARVMPE